MGHLYARDPRGETSALSCSRLAHGEASERACVRREVFPSGGTAWGDVEPKSCVRMAGVCSGEDRVGLVLKQASNAGGDYRVGFTQA